MPKPGGTRKDWRRAPAGSVEHYLFTLYPQGLEPGRNGGVVDMHRGPGALEGGRPAMNPRFLDRLDSKSWDDFHAAIAQVGKMKDGDRLLRVAAYFQAYKLNQARRITVLDLAHELHTTERNVSRMRDRFVELVTAILFNVPAQQAN